VKTLANAEVAQLIEH